MRTTKKAFKIVYDLISDGLLTEKEAYTLVEGLFEKEVVQIPVPIPTIEEENPADDTMKDIATTNQVIGFAR